MRPLILGTLSILAIGCSVYQSDGRKFLEDRGIEFAAGQNLKDRLAPKSCELRQQVPEELRNSERWVELEVSQPDLPELRVYSSEDPDSIALLVDHWIEDLQAHHLCLISYQSVREMSAQQEADINWALEQLE